MSIAVISLVTNIVLAVIGWGESFNNYVPPTGTYAIQIPANTVVSVGDSYNTTTQTFTQEVQVYVTPTPAPPETIADCVGTECLGDNNYLGGSFIRLWDPTGSGASQSLHINEQMVSLGGWTKIQLPTWTTDGTVGATLLGIRNQTWSGGPQITQGDLFVGRTSGLLDRYAKNTTATRYLANTGTNYSGEPNWDQVNLANGVTGTLPISSGGTGNTTGLSATSTALAANPTDCGANTYATAIDASGNLTCAQVDLISGSTGTLPVGRGGTGNTTGLATGFVTDPADCASNRYATAINASGVLTCAQVSLSAGVTGTLPVVNGGTGAAPGADDQLFVSSSMSAGAWSAIPNCTDSSGNHLNYTASTNSFSCGTSSSASPSVESDLTCDGTGAVNTTTATTVLNLPTFNNTGKTTVISGAISINQAAAGAARTYSVDVRLAGTTKITFTGKTESATSKITIPFHWVDSTCGSSCAYTITVTSDATTGTQTATDCAVSRVSY